MLKNKLKKYLSIVGMSVVLCGTFGLTYAYADDGDSEVVQINAENFPDDNFREYVSINIDKDINGELSLQSKYSKFVKALTSNSLK